MDLCIGRIPWRRERLPTPVFLPGESHGRETWWGTILGVSPMFSAALITIASTWKQPRCPLADKWIRKLYIYTMEYYSPIKKNAFESVLMRWMKLEPIIQSEVSQKEKHQYSILTYIYIFRKMVMMTLYERQQKRHRCKEQSFGLCGRGRGWDDLRERMYIIICKTDCHSRFDA